MRNEQGFVSILSTIFFILLMSVLTIGFLRIMADEQEQVVDSDLSKSALASAESGVEDAKRALIYCRAQTGPARDTCYSALNNSQCPGMFGDTTSSGTPNPLPTALALDKTAGDGSVRVGNPANNQRYTCVITSLQTENVIGQASEEQGEFIPLKGSADYNKITVWWHQTDVDGTAALPTAVNMNNNYRYNAWSIGGVRIAPMMRLQLVEFNRGNTLSQLYNKTVGLYATPTRSGGVSQMTIGSIDSNAWAVADKHIEVNCDTADTDAKGYLCGLTINVPANTLSDTKDYYLLVKSVYGSPHYLIDIAQNNTPVQFDDVQPQVDSTGAAADVFRRVISRVSYNADAFNTTNAVESGMSLCKDFFVTDLSATSTCLGL